MMEDVARDRASGLGTIERRTGVRVAVSSLIFVKLGDENGGIAFNISECGLALSAANDLPEGQLREVSIQLPDTRDWIRTAAQITWRSNSNREGGIRFVGMGEEARRRIREWIASETPSAGPTLEPESNSAVQRVERESTAPTPGDTVVSLGKEGKDASDAAPTAELGNDGGIPSMQPESEPAACYASVFIKEKDEDEVVADRQEIVEHVTRDPGNSLGRVERRTYERLAVSRLAVCSLIFVKLGDGNGGIALNMGEGGLALSAANDLPDGQIAQLSFQLPDSRDWIRTAGLIIWRSNSNKKCGVRFFGIREDDRRRIGEWIAAAMSSAGPSPKAESNDALQNAKLKGTASILGNTVVSIEKEDDQDAWDTALAADRRVHPRKRIIPLGYVQLGGENGGIALDVSEGGLSITVANALLEDNLPSIRLQFPDDLLWVDAKGEIVWRSESKKEAGVRFVDLPEQARLHLRNWLSSPTSPITVEQETEPTRRREKTKVPLKALGASELSRLGPIPDSSPTDKATEKAAESSRPQGAETSDASSLRADHARLGSRSRRQWVQRHPGVIRVTIKGGARAWTATVAVLVLIGAAPLIREWFFNRPQVTKRTIEVVAPKQPVETEIAESATQAPPANIASTPEAEPVPASQQPNSKPELGKNKAMGSIPTIPLKHLPAPVARSQSVMGTTAAKEPVRSLHEPPGLNQRNPESSPASVAVTNPTLQSEPPHLASVPPAPWPHEQAQLATAFSPVVSPPKEGAAAGLENRNGTKNGEGSSPPKRTEAAVRINGTVAITTDPYPAIRFSGASNGKKSRRGTSLRLGQLVSRVEPAYPEEALEKGVQGTVKIHVIVSAEGSIERLVSVDGPPLLVPGTVRAVQQWRYSQTLLAGQPVETEDNIAVTFGLSTAISR